MAEKIIKLPLSIKGRTVLILNIMIKNSKNNIKRTVLLLLSCAMISALWVLVSCTGTGAELEAKVKNITASTVGLPEAIDYFYDISAEDATAEFVSQPNITDYGTYTVKLKLNGAGQSKTYEASLTVIEDNEPPTIRGVADIYIVKGDSVAYRRNITVTDNCFGECTLDIDSSDVDKNTVGSYRVIYTATDLSGNTSKAQANVYVTYSNESISQSQLWSRVDPIIDEIITDGMTKEQKVRRVYEYVQEKMTYFDESDKGDWVKEAYLSLQYGYGDCFSYFAVAKAFLERLGIEYLDIQRTPGIVDETHYWCLVNIGEGGTDKWYHFDTCELRDDGYNHSGCLLTDSQIEAYNRVRENNDGVTGYFYAYDKSSYPRSYNKIITPTPNLS